MRTARLFLVAIVALCACGCLPLLGCAALPKTFDEGIQVIHKVATLMADQDVTWHADLSLKRAPNVMAGYQVTVDPGLRMSIHFQGNAKRGPGPWAPAATVADWAIAQGATKEVAEEVQRLVETQAGLDGPTPPDENLTGGDD